MKLFSEKVVPTFTSSNLNILGVRNFTEIFIDVFEFEINGKKFIAEKVSEHNGLPVVNIPVVLEGNEYTAPFVLRRGQIEVLFNKDNSTFIKPVLEEVQELIEQYTDDEQEKISVLIKNSINDLSAKLSKDIDNKAKGVEKLVNEKIINLTTNTIPNIFLKGSNISDSNALDDVRERLELIDKTITESESDKAKIYENLKNITDETIQLTEKIDKNSNRALSRIGNVKVQLEVAITDVSNKVKLVEDKISSYFDNNVAVIENTVKDLTKENKKYFIKLVNESKQSLLQEITKIKNDVPNIVIENADGKQEVNVKGIKTELEKIIGTKFTTEIAALKRLIELSSGGGSVAKQFANGGIMSGNLTVVGSISASNYLGLTIPEPDLSQYLPISGGTITNNLTVLGSISASNYLGLIVPTPDLSQYLPISGGTITGELSTTSNAYIGGNLTVFGNITSSGTAMFANTVFTTTSALSIINTGPGPAFYVYQAAGPHDVASFYDGDGVEVLHVGNANVGQGGRVGVNQSFPNKELTVSGEISATNTIYALDGNSTQWNSAYTTYSSNSASYATIGFTDSKYLPLSGGFLTGPLNTSSRITTSNVISSLNSQVYIDGTVPGYSLNLINRANFDPGQPLTVDGRARFVHGVSFAAGITNFTNGSDHSHVQWTSQGRSNWQMIQNGGISFNNRNSFILTTVGINANTQFFNESNIYSIDTTAVSANTTSPFLATGIKINYNTNATPTLTAGQFVQITFNPGAAGVVANTYSGTVSSGPNTVTIDGSTKFQYVFSLEDFTSVNWLSSRRGTELIYLNANGVNNVRVSYSPTDINGTQVGLSGNYLGIPRFVLAEITGHDAYAGESVILKITTTSKINLVPGDYNAYVRDVLDSNRFILSVGNAKTGFNITSGTTGGTGWALYKGSVDAVHQYTPALQHFYYQRFQTSDTNTRTTGGNRNVALGNSAEVDGDFSYAFGYKSAIFPSTTGGAVSAAAILGGENNFVYGNNSTAIGGQGLVVSGSNQFVTGKYNAIRNTSSTPFVVGWGTSDTNRSNLLELSNTTLTLNTSISASGGLSASNIKVIDDIEIADFTKGVIIRSPNNSRWRITINNDGALTTTLI